MRLSGFGLLLSLGVAACGHAAPAPATAAPTFRPEVWFQGRMHSTGALKVLTRTARGLKVDSVGQSETGGVLRLDQAIHWAGGATDHRFWRMKPIADDRYDVSLSDAKGPVFFEVHGARAHLRYHDRRGGFALTVEQWMDLQPDGRTLNNVGSIRLFGIPVARLDEVIEHAP